MPGRGLEFRFCPWAADIRKLIEHKNEELEQHGIIRTVRIIHLGAGRPETGERRSACVWHWRAKTVGLKHPTTIVRRCDEEGLSNYCSFAYSALASFRMGMPESQSERQHESRKLQINGVNLLRTYVAQH
jgi:hypothetical protein